MSHEGWDIAYSDLLPFARIACLHDSHQMSMLSLLLRLRSPTSGCSNIDTVLGHYRKSRQAGLLDLGLLGVLLRRSFLRNSRRAKCSGWRGHAGCRHAERSVSRVSEGGRRAWGWGEDWRGEARRLRFDWALEGGDWGVEDIVLGDSSEWIVPEELATFQMTYCSGEGTGIQVDGCMIKEVDSDSGQLVLLGAIANDIGIDQGLELLGSQSRLELERSAQKGLGDGERSSHCKGIRGRTELSGGGGGGGGFWWGLVKDRQVPVCLGDEV